MFRRILIAIDGSPTSNRGLDEAIGLASDQEAKICPRIVPRGAAATARSRAAGPGPGQENA